MGNTGFRNTLPYGILNSSDPGAIPPDEFPLFQNYLGYQTPETVARAAMPTVKFIKENKEIEVPEGANLRSEAIKAGINMHQGFNGMGASVNKFVNCKGWAQCGTCRVLITKGMENTSPMGFIEKTRFSCPVPTPVTIGGIDPLPCLAYVGHEDTMRLSCQTKVHGDIEVETGPEIDLFGENFFS